MQLISVNDLRSALQELGYFGNTALTEEDLQCTIKSVGAHLLKHCPPDKHPGYISFILSTKNKVNCWNDGKAIYITSIFIETFLAATGNDSVEEVISGPLAHELAHCILDHNKKLSSLKRKVNLEVLNRLMGSLLNPSSSSHTNSSQSSAISEEDIMREYHHQFEFEADALGHTISRKAYPHLNSIRVHMQALAELEGPLFATKASKSHPATSERLQRLILLDKSLDTTTAVQHSKSTHN